VSGLVNTYRTPPIATVELNRPERHNSLVPELLRDLRDVLNAVGNDEEVRVVVLAAAGESFSTGGDVRGFFTAGDRLAEYASETVGLLNEVILTLMRLDQPVVAAVHGIVTGGSLGLLLGADIVLMAPEATITPWYSAVGYSPDGGWTAILPNIIGKQRAAKILLQNETITAEKAVCWGLAAEVAPTVRERAAELASEIAAMRTGPLMSAKRLLHDDRVASALEAERAAFVAQILTPEAHEGMASFLGAAQ
jgi:2-(1,2-epoxy-1,2-dihydrophenyl)acetyl-CoA isomerase